MPSNQERRVNKQYLLPSYNPNQVSKRTRERWKLIFQKSFEHSINKKENQNQCFSSTGNNSSSKHSTDINEQLSDINIHNNINPEEIDQVLSTELTVLESQGSHVKRRKEPKKNHLKKLKKCKLNSNEGISTEMREVQDDLALMTIPINHKDNVQPLTEFSHLPEENASTLTISSSTSKYKHKKSKDDKKGTNDEVSKLTCRVMSMERTLSDLVQSFNSFRDLAMEKFVANEENWRQLKNLAANETSTLSEAPMDVNDIRRPPPVGYVRVDDDMIHLGRGVWLPQATFNNDIYTAGSSLAMVVKNIAVSVFGVEYLKSHSVKGKGSNKTKSIPRPAIDSTKALAIRDIFEYYLKSVRKMTGQKLMEEADLYEEYIRQKISDLIRPPRQSKKDQKSI